MDKGIVWIASYPKSGNTWFRAFLRFLIADSDDPALLRAIGIPNAASRERFDDLTGIDSALLSFDEIDRLRPMAYQTLLRDTPDRPVFLKAHDAFSPIFPPELTCGVIYLVRNPLDVAVSFGKYSGRDFDWIIERMADTTHCLSGETGVLNLQLRQQLLGWSGHAASWIESGLPIHVLRFEDLLANPAERFSAALELTGLQFQNDAVSRAAAAADFNRLRETERRGGFRESGQSGVPFFREGKAGSWRNHLTDEQVAKIVADHAKWMQKLGYLDDSHAILV